MEGHTHGSNARRLAVLIVVPALLVISGCYERVIQGDQSVYRFAWWLGPAVIAAGILGAPAGWFLRRVNQKWGFALMLMGPLLLIAVAPAMYSDRVVVDDHHFDARFGMWFSPTVQDIKFDDLREIRYVGVKDSRGRTKYELRCLTKQGNIRVVPAGDLVRNTVPEILEKARANGVTVVIEDQ